MSHIRGGAEGKRAERRRCSRSARTAAESLSAGQMEIAAAGEHVFAVESIEKRRSRKVWHRAPPPVFPLLFVDKCEAGGDAQCPVCVDWQGRSEYLVKWRGWSSK